MPWETNLEGGKEEEGIILENPLCSEAMASGPQFSIFYLVATFHSGKTLQIPPLKFLGKVLVHFCPKMHLFFQLQHSSALIHLCRVLAFTLPAPPDPWMPQFLTCPRILLMLAVALLWCLNSEWPHAYGASVWKWIWILLISSVLIGKIWISVGNLINRGLCVFLLLEDLDT